MLELEAYQLSIATAAGTLVETAARAAALEDADASGLAASPAPSLRRWRSETCSGGAAREQVRERLERP